ncbi:hypothetical protein [Sphaerobacter sp.]|uniref:hypothetical protein n=1 Tax=Sphaerobacter sp. TaxID=2099654 RepID=UPI001DF8BEC5|nr:hypothetical protein [Sphaerobacter sp.]MBX5444128.1 hypothetical protein [Sphaerobacter sp.]
MMPHWLFTAQLLLHAHFAASYLVPLDETSQGAFGGLLRWVWPWAVGNRGPLGTVTKSASPLTGFWLAVTSALAFLLAALAVAGLWVPLGWWRPLAITGAILSLFLLVAFISPTKYLPIALNLFLLWRAVTDRLPATVS